MATNKKKKKSSTALPEDQFDEIIRNMGQEALPSDVQTPQAPVTPPIPGMGSIPQQMQPQAPQAPAPQLQPQAPQAPAPKPPVPMPNNPVKPNFYSDDIYQEVANGLSGQMEQFKPEESDEELGFFGRVGKMLSTPEGLAQIGMFGAGAAGDLKGMDAYTTRYSNILEARRAETEAKKAQIEQRMWELKKAQLESRQKRADYLYERDVTGKDATDKVQFVENGVNKVGFTDRNGNIIPGSVYDDQVSVSGSGRYKRLNDGQLFDEQTGEIIGEKEQAQAQERLSAGVYRRDDGSAFRVETNKDGDVITKPVSPAEMTQIQQYDAKVAILDAKTRELAEMNEIVKTEGTTGYIDQAAGWVEGKFGIGGEQSKKSNELRIKADAITKFFTEDAKNIIGTAQISDGDRKFMEKFSGIDLTSNEDTVKKQIQKASEVMGSIQEQVLMNTPYRQLDSEGRVLSTSYNKKVTGDDTEKQDQNDTETPEDESKLSPAEKKIRRLMKEKGLTRKQAENEVNLGVQ